jgi:hypothetical protein
MQIAPAVAAPPRGSRQAPQDCAPHLHTGGTRPTPTRPALDRQPHPPPASAAGCKPRRERETGASNMGALQVQNCGREHSSEATDATALFEQRRAPQTATANRASWFTSPFERRRRGGRKKDRWGIFKLVGSGRERSGRGSTSVLWGSTVREVGLHRGPCRLGGGRIGASGSREVPGIALATPKTFSLTARKARIQEVSTYVDPPRPGVGIAGLPIERQPLAVL